jgi:hypothetical protein
MGYVENDRAATCMRGDRRRYDAEAEALVALVLAVMDSVRRSQRLATFSHPLI